MSLKNTGNTFGMDVFEYDKHILCSAGHSDLKK